MFPGLSDFWFEKLRLAISVLPVLDIRAEIQNWRLDITLYRC